MKLKTLKDLKEGHSCVAYEERIKQEAIKWVKEIREDLKPYEKLQGKPANQKDIDFVVGNIATEQWIIMFHNITEDDLK